MEMRIIITDEGKIALMVDKGAGFSDGSERIKDILEALAADGIEIEQIGEIETHLSDNKLHAVAHQTA